MFERQITPEEVAQAVETGRGIEEYPDDKPFPSVLVLGYHHDRPLHVVVGKNSATGTGHVITAYEPSPKLWSDDFATRRKR